MLIVPTDLQTIPGVSNDMLAEYLQQEPDADIARLQENCRRVRATKQFGKCNSLSSTINSQWQLALLASPSRFFSQNPNLIKEYKDNLGRTAAHYCALLGFASLLEPFIETDNPYLFEKDFSGANLLHFAALSGSKEAIAWVLEFDPDFAAQHWQRKDDEGDTPDTLAGKNGFPSGVTKTLEGLIRIKLASVQQDCPASQQESALHFLKAFCRKTVDMLVAEHEESPEQLEKLKLYSSCRFLFEGEFGQRLEALLKVSQIRRLAFDKSITKKTLFEAVSTLESIARTQQTLRAATWGESIKAWSSLHTATPKVTPHSGLSFCENVFLLLLKVSGQENEPLSSDAALVLHHFVECYRRATPPDNPIIREAFNKALAYLETCKELQALRPNTRVDEAGFELGEANHEKHLTAMKDELTRLPGINEDTRRLTTQVLECFQHIAKNKDEIVTHHMEKFGVLYNMPHDIPLHTDHTERPNEIEFRETLIRLLDEAIGAYLIAKRAGQQERYFDILAKGYCLEGRSRDCFTWAANISEVKPFFKLMESYIHIYQAYLRVMQGIDEEKSGVLPLQRALDFMITHYAYFS